MSSKKRSKASKLARMTEDERLRYLHHRAVMEEEAQHRKQKLVASFLINKMKHEEAFSRLNLPKINQYWRHLLRQIKCKELKQDTVAMKNRFEMIIQCKNKIINSLLSDFEFAEIQYSTQFQKHIEMISKFMELYNSRLDISQEWYTQQLKVVLEKRNTDMEEMIQEIEKDKMVLKSESNDSVEKLDAQIQQWSNRFKEKENQLCHKLLCNLKVVEHKFGFKLSSLQEEYRTILNNFNEQTLPKMTSYTRIREKDEEDSSTILKNEKLIMKLEEKIQKMKKECSDSEGNYNKDKEMLQDKYKGLMEEFQKLTKQLETDKALDRGKLKILSSVTTNILTELESILRKSEQVVQVVKNCNKISVAPEFELKNIASNDTCINEGISAPYDKLECFWKRYNELFLQTESLKTEKKLAVLENEKLKKKLRRYIKSIRKVPTIPHKNK